MKTILANAETILTDEELDQASGGGFDPVYDIMLGRSRPGQRAWEQTPWQDNKNTF